MGKKNTLIKRKTINISEISVLEKEDDFEQEKEIVNVEFKEIEFLWHFMEDICRMEQLIGTEIAHMVSYNLVRYYIFLLRKFNGSFKS